MRKGGHVRLTREDCDEKDLIIAGKSYHVRYLGSSEISRKKANGKGCTNESVREIYSRYSTKTSIRSLAKRELFVSANCVSLYASTEHAVLFRFQTVNITFCNTSEENRNAFAFVVKGSHPRPLTVHVVHCENAAQANELALDMQEAFTVRSALYQAKRIDRAGWANGLLSPTHAEADENGLNGEDEPNEEAIEIDFHANGDDTTSSKYKRLEDTMDTNNNFGDFVLPCSKNICGESRSNNNDNNNSNITRYPNGVRFQNGSNIPRAKVLLQNGLNKARCNSIPSAIQSPWASKKGEWGRFQSPEDDDTDDFSLLARERSSSMKLLTAE